MFHMFSEKTKNNAKYYRMNVQRLSSQSMPTLGAWTIRGYSLYILALQTDDKSITEL